MLQRLKVNLHKPYLTKAFDQENLKKALAYEPAVVYSLYCVKNEVKEIQKFLKTENSNFDLIAHVRTNYAFVGDARQQVWNTKPFSKLVRLRPKYTFYCALGSTITHKLLYYKKVETLKPETIYDLIESTQIELQKMIDSH
jgi:hypothetical protein